MKVSLRASRVFVVSFTLFFLQLVLGPTGAGAQARSAALESLIKAAAAEGQLDMLGSVPHEPKAWEKWEKLMRARYGIDVRLRFTPGPDMAQMSSRLINEFKAGKPASTDVYVGSEPPTAALWEAGALLSVEWTELGPYIPREAVAPGNVGLALSSLVRGITYNTRLVPKDQVPRVLNDLLDPKWKGKIASTPYGASFDHASLVLGDERVTKFVQELARGGNLAGLIRCAEEQRIATGEFAILALNCSANEGEILRRKGAPIADTILEDLPMIGHHFVAVPKHSPHPNLAKLFAVFMLTEEAQQVLWEHEAFDLHLIKGTNLYKEVQSWRSRGIEPHLLGPQLAEVGKSLPRLREKYAKILRGQ